MSRTEKLPNTFAKNMADYFHIAEVDWTAQWALAQKTLDHFPVRAETSTAFLMVFELFLCNVSALQQKILDKLLIKGCSFQC